MSIRVKVSLTKEARIVQSSHQNVAFEILLASSRRATATVAEDTLMTEPSHTFHATLSSAGNGLDMVAIGLSEGIKETLENDCRRYKPSAKVK